MNPVDRIRNNYKSNLLFDLAAKPHRKRIMHLDDIRTIGIITHAPSEEEQVTISQFTHHMTNRGSMVRKIEIPSVADEILDKYGLPKPDFTRLFTSYHYDLLIDATPFDDPFGIYVTLISSSSLRVGYVDASQSEQDINTATYDLIIRGDGPCRLSKYLTDLLNYLIQIRK